MAVAANPVPVRDLAEARLAVYRFLRAALDKPTVEQHAWLTSDAFHQRLDKLAVEFAVDPCCGELVPPDPADHEARYIACFEVGLPEPPVVLLASHYNRREPVTAVIHEHKLFYRWFKAGHSIDEGEPPDHLLNELGFLIHLDELLLKHPGNSDAVSRGRRDFLARHVAVWVARAAESAGTKHLPGIYRTLLAVLAAVVAQDRTLTELAQAADQGAPA